MHLVYARHLNGTQEAGMVATSGSNWRLAPSLVALVNEADDLAPNRTRVSDGSIGDTAHSARTSDHNPDDGGVVRAVDLTHDPAGGFDAHAYAEKLRQRKDRRIKYVISNGRMFSSYATSSRPAWTWGPYSGSNPHDKHVHHSILGTTSAATDTSPWFPQEGGGFLAELSDKEQRQLYDWVKRIVRNVEGADTAAKADGDKTPTLRTVVDRHASSDGVNIR